MAPEFESRSHGDLRQAVSNFGVDEKLPRAPWSLTTSEFLSASKVDPKTGLSASEVQSRFQMFGPNTLGVEKRTPRFQIFFRQLKSPVVVILLVATLISSALGEMIDAIAILTIVLINSFVGFLQEIKAEAAVEALKKISAPDGRVLRSGHIHQVRASEIVPGDLIFLEAGDLIPADARLIEGHQVTADESVLTGESLPVEKTTEALPVKTAMVERRNMLFAGTALTTGTAKALVSATGRSTELGQIANLLEKTERAGTPLQMRLEEVSQKLLKACALVVLLVAGLGVYHHEKWLDVVMTAISLSVAAIPEGLPTVVTLALALAIRRMSYRNAIVKDLPAVETLGSTSVICTDKTGTLTTGKMKVHEAFLLGLGLLPEPSLEPSMTSMIESAVLCSNASLNHQGVFTGDPTEIALLEMAQKQGLDLAALRDENPRLWEWSFESHRKRMTVACRRGDQISLHCKGAPESVLEICELAKAERQAIEQAIQKLSSQGRRLLAMSSRVFPESELNLTQNQPWQEVEKQMRFLGLVAISDQIRPESFQAIADCHLAGIKVVMITGDHPLTAQAIARELGILKTGFDQVLSGSELETMSKEKIQDEVQKTAVFARVSPEHKLKIVQAWQNLGEVVAMTGDGVNDAPALKQASIGVSMGRQGTEVARQASSMILADDNFATIVSAIEEGRAIYGNIRRTIQYLFSGNLAEIMIMLGAAMVGWPTPLAPLHLLWINLVTDGLPSLALAAEPVPEKYLKSTLKPSPEKFFDRKFYREMIFVSLAISVLCLWIYGYSLRSEGEAMARTHVFTFLVFAELFRSFACRSEDKTFFQLGPFSNVYHLIAIAIPICLQLTLQHFPVFQEIFKVQRIDWSDYFFLISLTLIPVTAVEIRKLWKTRAKQSYQKPVHS